MASQIFVNLPVKDLDRSIKFFTSLGFTFNPTVHRRDRDLHDRGREHLRHAADARRSSRTFTPKPICDATQATEVLVCLALGSRAEVEDMVAKAVAAGGHDLPRAAGPRLHVSSTASRTRTATSGSWSTWWPNGGRGLSGPAHTRCKDDRTWQNTMTLIPASELVKRNNVRFPNESDEYRRARDALLAEEIELRRHIERVAEQRRALPLRRAGDQGLSVRRARRGRSPSPSLFGPHQTLVVYSYMFGPQRERPCPMCTSLLSAWDGEARDVDQRVALAVVARSPIERLVAFKTRARLEAPQPLRRRQRRLHARLS